jgi:hypothetical protein
VLLVRSWAEVLSEQVSSLETHVGRFQELGILHGEVTKLLILFGQVISLIWSRESHKQALKIPHLGPLTME